MSSLLLADLHLSDKSHSDYRWELFPWLVQQAEEHAIKTIYMAGDITDVKDRHNAKFTNRVVREFIELSQHCELVIMMGNHDYIDPAQPFFGFLDDLPNIHYVKKATIHEDPELGDLLLLPHSRVPEVDYGDIDQSNFAAVLAHQSVIGATASEFYDIAHGLSHRFFDESRKTWAGDIHCPQVHGKLEYIGSPYHVHFGDLFEPRTVLLDGDATVAARELVMPSPQRVTLRIGAVEDLGAYALRPGDHVKVQLKLSRADVHQWSLMRKRVREVCSSNGWHFHGCQLEVEQTELSQKFDEAGKVPVAQQRAVASPEETLLRFAAQQEIGGLLLDKGKAFLSSTPV